ncbi:MAG: polysaccharide deacetylase family protein [Flavobacteriales bacterium]|nr:MAG: polysaccharide deacetylase family protein [Flavobacteriales bacterium]
MFLAKSPAIVKKYYSKLVWDIPNDENKIYLTFDDGPIPEITEWVLDVLKEHNIQATFFCIGKNVENHTEIFQRILKEGHQVANHSNTHVNGWYAEDSYYLEDIKKCQDKFASPLFRPPYGRIKKSQIAEVVKDYKIIMWDVLSGDFDPKTTPENCYINVIKNTKSGSVIVFHDSIKAAENLKYALPKAIEYLLEKGYVFDVVK